MALATWTRRGFAVALAAIMGGCGPVPTAETTKQAIAKLPRASYLAPGPEKRSVSYLFAGDPDGRRVIFVHGTPGDAMGFGEYLLHVPKGFEYISIDRPGFGKSDPYGAVTSLAEQASALEPLLVERHGHWPLLVGHSLGGPIIVRAALDRPHQIEGLLILAGALDPAQEKVHPLQRLGELWPIRPLLPRNLRNTNHELLALKPQLVAMQPLLSNIHCPIGIVHGTKDSLVPYANLPYMQKYMTSAQINVHTIKDQDHFLPWTNAADVTYALSLLVAANGRECAGPDQVVTEKVVTQ